MSIILDIVAQVRRLKTEKQLSLKTPLKRLTIFWPTTDLNIDDIKKQEQLIKGICQAETIVFVEKEKGPSQLIANDGTFDAQINLENMPLP
jgi:valyl-tRNA synthetase